MFPYLCNYSQPLLRVKLVCYSSSCCLFYLRKAVECNNVILILFVNDFLLSLRVSTLLFCSPTLPAKSTTEQIVFSTCCPQKILSWHNLSSVKLYLFIAHDFQAMTLISKPTWMTTSADLTPKTRLTTETGTRSLNPRRPERSRNRERRGQQRIKKKRERSE